ncbi:MAG: amidase [Anaerolineaceae bacterium]|nr:amidase [Anaerolineaceae bacterium]
MTPFQPDWTISELQELLSSGVVTSRNLVEAYLDRIETIDRQGPGLNAIIEINPDALAIAARLDRQRKAGKMRGPLHGIPIVLKDNIDTADRMMTTAGSLALEGSIAAQDAGLVTKLRKAGAILLAKANLSEWANFRSDHSNSGWSSRGGQTHNPYALDRSPCGSSSGSAVAVAAGLCAAAVGTETDGSITCPAQTNGVVGIKPTLGLISRSGIIPIAHSQDTAGPLARCVRDAAILLGAMAEVDLHDAATAQSARKAYPDYTQFLDPDGLKGARIGVARNFFDFHPEVDALMEACLDGLKAGGAVLIDPANIDSVKTMDETEIEALLYEFKADLNVYLSRLGPDARVHSMEELIAFNEKNHELVMPYFGQKRMLQAQEKGPLTDEAYRKAVETNHRLARSEGIDAVMAEHKLDAFVAPTGGPAWLIDYVHGDYGYGGCTSPAAVAGYPHITVPAGFIHGLPVGISFFGAAWSEPVLLRLAYAFEQATRARQAPRYLPTISF